MRTLIRLLALFGVLAVLAVPVLHLFFVFPGAVFGKVVRFTGGAPVAPKGVKSATVVAADGKEIDLWYYPAAAGRLESPYRVLFFHGNGGDLKAFFVVQQWLSSLGIPSYGFDYRGYGRSSGWPTEKGLYLDSRAVLRTIIEDDKVPADKLIFFAISIGTAPAAELAAEQEPALTVLLSPFSALDALLLKKPGLRILHPLLWWKFPVSEHVRKLKNPLIIAHGESDTLIPISEGEAVHAAYPNPENARFIRLPGVGHNDLFFASRKALEAELLARRIIAAPGAASW